MNRFYIISFVLHLTLFGVLVYVNRSASTPLPNFNVVKVHIAPLPQPKVIEPEKTDQKEEIKPAKEEPPQKKVPPKKKNIPKKKTKIKSPPTKQKIKKGLPDIKPTVYTGSGRGFTYSYYLNILLNKINKNWKNPFKGKDIVFRSVVYFEVDKHGKIYNVRLEDDSGNDLYNETTMRAVIVTKRLPPLPQEFSDDYLKVHLEFLTAQ